MRGGHNRKLRRDRPNPESPRLARGLVPSPPRSLSAAERRAWRDLAEQVAPSYTHADRRAFELLVKLTAKFENAPDDMAPSAYARLAQIIVGLLQQFGCTPRSRNMVIGVVQPKATAEDPAAEARAALARFAVLPGGGK